MSGDLWDLKIKCLVKAQGQIGVRLCVSCCGGPSVESFLVIGVVPDLFKVYGYG